MGNRPPHSSDMLFDDQFLRSLPDDWAYAIPIMLKKYHAATSKLDADSCYPYMQEFVLLMEVYKETKKLDFIRPPRLSGQRPGDTAAVRVMIDQMKNHVKHTIAKRGEKARLAHCKDVFEIALQNAFCYEFSEGDLQRVQSLVNELRDLISKSQEFDAGHKRRVLMKLERLQSELHKKLSDLSQFWGDLIEVSVVARIVGENAKPIIDRIREIIGIVGPAQARAFGLPSNTPFQLPGTADSEEKNEVPS